VILASFTEVFTKYHFAKTHLIFFNITMPGIKTVHPFNMIKSQTLFRQLGYAFHSSEYAEQLADVAAQQPNRVAYFSNVVIF
jgi:hypothetical protein